MDPWPRVSWEGAPALLTTSLLIPATEARGLAHAVAVFKNILPVYRGGCLSRCIECRVIPSRRTHSPLNYETMLQADRLCALYVCTKRLPVRSEDTHALAGPSSHYQSCRLTVRADSCRFQSTQRGRLIARARCAEKPDLRHCRVSCGQLSLTNER
jgi:hypothetical protein